MDVPFFALGEEKGRTVTALKGEREWAPFETIVDVARQACSL